MSALPPPHQIAASFVQAIEAGGVKPSYPIDQDLLTGNLVRFDVDGDRSGRRNGWARLFLDGRPAGAFGCNKRQINEKWTLATPQQSYTPAQKKAYGKAMAAKRQAAADAKAAVIEAAAERAGDLLLRAGNADPNHPYLTRKCIPATGLHQIHSSLLAPMSDAAGRVWNIQFISPEGEKVFLKGGRTTGLCWPVHGTGDQVLIGEGVATMAAVHSATGRTCYAAFSAGNLLEAARMARLIHPEAEITICADDDTHLVDHPQVRCNVGLKHATAAATEVNAMLAMPLRPISLDATKGWDFADVRDPRAIRVALDQAHRPVAATSSIGPFGSIAGRLEGCAW